MPATFKKPINSYLLAAFRDWLSDNGQKVHIAVDSSQLNDPVLLECANTEGKVILNISPQAVVNYYADEYGLSFRCRLRGKDHPVMVPLSAIHAIWGDTPDLRSTCVLPPLPRSAAPARTEKAPTETVERAKVVSLDQFRKK